MKIFFASTKKMLIEAISCILSDLAEVDIAGTINSLAEPPGNPVPSAGDVIVLTEPGFECSTICALQKLTSFCKGIAVVLVTSKDEHDSPTALFRYEVKSVLTKECGAKDLHTAVLRASAGKPYLTQKIAQAMAADYLNCKRNIVLSPRETEVLGFIARGKKTSEIAKRLCISVKTVSAYKSNIKNRLNIHSTSQMVQYAIEHDIFIQ